MKILITGANGFIGSNAVREALNREHNVVAFSKNGDNSRIGDLAEAIRLYRVDLRELATIEKVITSEKPEAIFHFATYGSYPSRQKDRDEMIRTNIAGTANLIQATAGIPLINTGSSSEYGIKEAPMSEIDLCSPSNDYGWAKLCQTLYCQRMKIPTLRLFSAYGPYEDENRLIPTLIRKKINGGPLSLVNSVRDYCYVEDICDAFFRALEKYPAVQGEVVNVSSGKQSSVVNLLEIMHPINSRELAVEWNFKPVQQEPKIWVANIEKAKKLLSWSPRHNLEEGLKKTYGWWKNECSRIRN